jgi:hypothetical protein
LSETRTVHDPFLNKDVQVSARLTDRLRGKYAVGPIMPDGEPKFGWREYPVPPIQPEAAAEIDRLSAQLVEAVEESDDLQRTFDLQWEADQRAIKRWLEAHPGNDLVWPDRADVVVWLMEELAKVQSAHWFPPQEKTASDAPTWYGPASADAWASGYNSAAGRLQAACETIRLQNATIISQANALQEATGRRR